MLRKIAFSLLFVLVFVSMNGIRASESSPPEKTSYSVGIIVPIEHKALVDMVQGFKDSLSKQVSLPVQYHVQNAQGDIKLQRSIIENFVGQKMDLIVPIGTTSTQMTLSIVKTQPIVSLDAVYPETERQKRLPRNITGILGEVDPAKKLDFIKQIFPSLKKVTVIFHSANERNFPEMKALTMQAKKIGVEIQSIMIQNLPELQAARNAIAKDSGAILIFKDHLVASGVRLLVPISEKLKLPLITSDEGSVHEGGAFALGVSENAIGEEGGILAAKVLKGTPIESLPMKPMAALTVFYNPTTCQKLKIDVSKLQRYAEKNQYRFVATDFRTKK